MRSSHCSGRCSPAMTRIARNATCSSAAASSGAMAAAAIARRTATTVACKAVRNGPPQSSPKPFFAGNPEGSPGLPQCSNWSQTPGPDPSGAPRPIPAHPKHPPQQLRHRALCARPHVVASNTETPLRHPTGTPSQTVGLRRLAIAAAARSRHAAGSHTARWPLRRPRSASARGPNAVRDANGRRH